MTSEDKDPSLADSLRLEEFRSWPSSKFADPKSVEHGIRLAKPIMQTARSWWALRWLSIIQQFGLGVRLERAKLYAMRGQVLSIQIENGVVKSLVQGADDEPYRAIIAVKTIPKAIWTSILSDLARSSSFGIQVASGVLPSEEEIDQTFKENGVLLFPDRQGEMQTKCSCLDWSNPCKHIAAVYLLLAAEFERDPLLIFKLRGLAPADLFAMLKTQTAEQSIGESDAAGSVDTEPVAESSSSRSGKSSKSRPGSQGPKRDSLPAGTKSRQSQQVPGHQPKRGAIDCRGFWKKSVKPSDVQDSWSAPTDVASLPRSLGEFPFWQGNTDLLSSVQFVYEVAPAYATEVLSHSRQHKTD